VDRLHLMVREFYRVNDWDRVRGDGNSAVKRLRKLSSTLRSNTGTAVAIKLAQVIVGAVPDGDIGPKTVKLLNQCTAEKFVPTYALAKIQRYVNICPQRPKPIQILIGLDQTRP
jgi:lysozyme family protein